MKKIIFISLITFILFTFSGCEMLLNILLDSSKVDKNQPAQKPVDSVAVIPITKTKTDISKYVENNSKVWVIQVNPTDIDKNSTYSGTLKNSVNFSSSENEYSRSVTDSKNSIKYINEVPDFVKNFKPLPKFSSEVEEQFSSEKSERSGRFAYDDFDESKHKIGDVVCFNLPTEKPTKSFVPFDCILKYESKYAYIFYCPNISWLENDNYGETYLSDEDFEKLGIKFDSLYEAETNLMGNRIMKGDVRYIKTPNKISVVVNDIECDSTKDQEGGTFGYFYGMDLYTNRTLELYNRDDGNSTQVIYIDSYFLKNAKEMTYSTLAHEFNHLLNYINKEVNKEISQNNWFTEMLSMTAEDLLFDSCLKDISNTKNKVISNRIPYFLGGYNIGFTSWNSGNTYQNYGNTFAYGAFLVRNYGGPDLINRIATNGFVNEEAITEALKAGTIKIKDPDTGKERKPTFEDTFLDFCISSINYSVTAESNLSTFNKAQYKDGKYKYSAQAINLMSYKAEGKNTSENGLYVYTNGNTAIGSHGFVVQYAGLGKDVNTINVTLPKAGIKMYCVVQNY